MSDINAESMTIAPGVMETIVVLAVRDVPGVLSVGSAPSGIRSLFAFKQSTQGVQVSLAQDETVQVAIAIHVSSGYSLDEIATSVRKAVADAILTQVGLEVSRVDITVESIQFQD